MLRGVQKQLLEGPGIVDVCFAWDLIHEPLNGTFFQPTCWSCSAMFYPNFVFNGTKGMPSVSFGRWPRGMVGTARRLAPQVGGWRRGQL